MNRILYRDFVILLLGYHCSNTAVNNCWYLFRKLVAKPLHHVQIQMLDRKLSVGIGDASALPTMTAVPVFDNGIHIPCLFRTVCGPLFRRFDHVLEGLSRFKKLATRTCANGLGHLPRKEN